MDELSGDMQYVLQAFTDLEDRLIRIENAQGMDENLLIKFRLSYIAYIV